MNMQISLSICLLLGIGVVPAKAQAGAIRARIPFEFSVAGKTFSAGEYTMVIASQQVSVVSVADGRTIALAWANQVSSRSGRVAGEVIFHCYERQCFLAEVWSPREENGRRLLPSRSEVELARERTPRYFAILGIQSNRN